MAISLVYGKVGHVVRGFGYSGLIGLCGAVEVGGKVRGFMVLSEKGKGSHLFQLKKIFLKKQILISNYHPLKSRAY